jgi:hypothetical protein
MPVTPQAVPHLEGKGHEAVHAANIGLATEPDSALLERRSAPRASRPTPPEPYLNNEFATPPVLLRLRRPVAEHIVKRALRATLDAAHLLGLAAGVHLRSLRAQKNPLADALARLQEAELRASLAWEAVEILGARLDKLPERKRPFYTPSHRFRILEIKSLLGWSQHRAAKLFRVCPNTIANWEAHADPASRTVGSTVKPTPPRRCGALTGSDHEPPGFRRAGAGRSNTGPLVLEDLGAVDWPYSAGALSQPSTLAATADQVLPPSDCSLREPRLDDGRDDHPDLPGR